MPAKKPKPDEKPQFERFLETVKQVEADETDAELERAFDKRFDPITKDNKKPT